MASCTTGEGKGDRAASHHNNSVKNAEAQKLLPLSLESSKMPKSLDDDVLDTNLDILFVGYRAESSLQPILNGLINLKNLDNF